MLSIHLPFLPSQVMLDAVHPPSFLPFPLKSCLMLSIHLPFFPSQVMLDAVHPPSYFLPSQVMLDAVHPPSFPSLSSHA